MPRRLLHPAAQKSLLAIRAVQVLAAALKSLLLHADQAAAQKSLLAIHALLLLAAIAVAERRSFVEADCFRRFSITRRVVAIRAVQLLAVQPLATLLQQAAALAVRPLFRRQPLLLQLLQLQWLTHMLT